MNRSSLSFGVCLVAAFSLHAKTVLYVDDDNYNPDYSTCQQYKDAGFDGSTEEKAFGTIQMAVDAIGAGAKEEPNEIVVLPGVYDKGVSDALVNGNTQGRSRVFVDQKPWIRIRSRDGAAVTHIVGALDPNTITTDQRGNGDNAVRGVCSYYSYGLRVTGFTIRDCASMIGDGQEHNYSEGSAVMTIVQEAPTFVADCVISNCVARDGVVFGGMCFRTLICDNVATVTSIIRGTDLYSSIVTRNWSSSGDILCSLNPHFVNCTVVNNKGGWVFYGGYVYNTIVSHCCGTDNELYHLNDALGNVSTADGNVYQTIAPALGDFRLIDGCAAETAGDPACLAAEGFYRRSEDWFPTEWLNRDFNGNPIVAKDGKVMAGAIQETVVPAGGRIEFASDQIGVRLLSVEGHGCWFSGIYAYPVAYPVQWRVSARLASGEELYGYSYSDSAGRDNKSGRYLFPHLDGTVVLTPPPDPSCCVRRTVEVASRVVWADPTAVKAEQDGSFEHPYRELCDVGTAIENESRVIVKLKSGTYEEGEIEHWGLNNRFSIRGGSTSCRFVGVEGAENTFIRGAADSDNPSASAPGCGPNAMRIFTSQSSMNNCQMQGITFSEGFTRASSSGVDSGHGGLCYVNGNVVFSDCVITNCGGVFDLASCGSFARCKIVDCHPTQRIVFGNDDQAYPAIGCYFENVSTAGNSYDIFTQMPFFECTVVDTLGWGLQRGYKSESALFGCVLSGGGVLKCGPSAGNVLWNYAGTAEAEGCVSVDPLLIGEGQPTLFAKSAAVRSGAQPTTANAGADFFMYDGADIDGNKLTVSDGRFAAGARHTVCETGVYVSAPRGGIAVGGGNVGYNAPDGELTLTVGAGERPCVGFVVGGATNLYDEVVSRTISPAEAASGLFVEALYSNEWRVRPDGSDSDFGFTTNTAFRTLQYAMSKAVSGDVVRAGPGVYREGGDDTTDYRSVYVRSRVVVNSGVTLVSDCGPEQTVIEGAADTETPDSLNGNPADPEKWGCGPNAMRCVYLKSDATVRGFTLRGGRTRGVTDLADIGYRLDYSGGGVLGSSRTTSIVENCVITNCGAYRGGAVRIGTLKKCRVTDCFALYDAAGVAEGSIYGCLVEHARGGQPANWDLGYIADSTFRDTRSLDGAAEAIPWTFNSALGAGAAACNVAVIGYLYYQGVERNVFTTNIANGDQLPVEHPEVIITTASAMALDDEGRPIPGKSILTEKANAILDVVGFDYFSDLSGFQRVMNGARDVGALEADWREIYREDIGRRRIVVEAVTPGVVESDARTVCVPEGEAVRLTVCDRKSVPYLLRFSVPAEGSLRLTVDGAEAVYGAGTHEVKIEPEGADKDVVLAATSGVSEILKGRSLVGMCVTIR